MAEEEQQEVEQQEPEQQEPEQEVPQAPEPQAAEGEPAEAEAAPEPQAAEEGPPEPAEDAPPAEAPAEAAADVAEQPAAEAAPEQVPTGEPADQVRRKKKRLPRSQRRQRSKPAREKPAERKPIVRLPKPEGERGRKQERRGVVVSNAMDKTIVVQVETVKAHPRYKKVVRRSRRFHAHDSENAANVGDVVRIVESRPLSKTKTWRLVEIVEQAR